MTIKLPDLPYDHDALEPHISAETLRLHHDAHHAKYVKKTNALAEDTPLDGADLETLVTEAEGALLQNAAQAWNHQFYWESLAPDGGGDPDHDDLRSAIDDAFGGVDELRELFTKRATSHFGSGWAWLVREPDGRLAVICTHDHGCPLRDGKTPLLTCDMWEHAYYVDRRNDKAAYLESFWQLVDWDAVARRFEAAGKAKDPKRSSLLAAGSKAVSALLSVGLVFGALALPGCGEDGAEEAGEEIDEAAEELGDHAEDAVDAAQDVAEEATDEAEEAMDGG